MKNLLCLLILALPSLLLAQAQEATILGNWDDPDLVGSSFYDNTYNEIWGYAKDGREYAILGSTAGTHIIEVTDPTTPVELFLIEGAVQGGQVIHRDYHDLEGFLYAVCDEGNSTLQIIDLNQLPNAAPVIYDSQEDLRNAHNIFIDEPAKRMYCFAAFGGEEGYSAMRVYDISTPGELEFMAEHNLFGSLIAGHVHDGYVRNHLAFLNCGNDGFAVVDFTDAENPVTLHTLTNYPFAGYNHSGWTTDDCGYYYLADENHGFNIKVLDVRNPCETEVVSSFDADVEVATSIPHNQIVACNYLYVSYYYDGLRVYDLTDPEQPELVLYYDTYGPPDGTSYKGAWGVYPFLPSGNILLSDMQTGLYIFEGMGDNCYDNRNITPCNIECLTTSTADLEEVIDLKVFPQPGKDWLNVNIKLIEAQKSVNLALFDITGQLVKRFPVEDLQEGENQIELELGKISPGFYALRLFNTDFEASTKVVIGK